MSIDRAIIRAKLEAILKDELGEVVDLSLIAKISRAVDDEQDVPAKVVRVPRRPRNSLGK